MNKPVSLVEALQGKTSPISHLAWMYRCDCCGHEDFCGGYPISGVCIGCGGRVEATENPEYVAPVSRMTLQSAE